MACRNGCGRPSFGKFPTCCTHCKSHEGPHAGDCDRKAMESRKTAAEVSTDRGKKGLVPFVHRDKHPIETFESVWAKAQTGDILLVSGAPDLDSPMAKSIKLATRSAFSHIGLIVREPTEAMWKTYGHLRGKAPEELGTGAWGAGEVVPRNRLAYVFDSDYEEDGTVDGPVLRPLEDVIKAYTQDDYHGTEVDIVVRRLQVEDARRPDIIKGFDKFADEVAGRCFEAKSMMDGAFTQMLMSVWGGNKEEDLTRLFCSELAAATYEAAGLLSNKENATNYQPTHFAEGSIQMDNLLGGASLGPEVVLDLNELLYDISVTIENTQGLSNPYTNPFRIVDPYCKCYLAGRKRFQTCHISRTLNPTWKHEQVMKYDGVSPMRFEVYDKAKFSKDFRMGFGELKSEEFVENGFRGPVTIKQTDGTEAKLNVTVKILRTAHPPWCVGGSTDDHDGSRRRIAREKEAERDRRQKRTQFYRWRELRHGEPIPTDAVQAGVTAKDDMVWVGRVNGEAGKINAEAGNMHKFWGQGEGEHQECEVLCFEGDWYWISIESGQPIPPNAVKAGETKKDGVTYVGRFQGEAGKINVDKGAMWNFWGHGEGRQEKGVSILTIEGREWDESLAKGRGKGKGGYHAARHAMG